MRTRSVCPVTGDTASQTDSGACPEGPVGVPASDDTTESSVFHVQEPTFSAPSAYVAGPAKVENPHGFRGFKSLRLRKNPAYPAGFLVSWAPATALRGR